LCVGIACTVWFTTTINNNQGEAISQRTITGSEEFMGGSQFHLDDDDDDVMTVSCREPCLPYLPLKAKKLDFVSLHMTLVISAACLSGKAD
jgi:hypothetical protein